MSSDLSSIPLASLRPHQQRQISEAGSDRSDMPTRPPAHYVHDHSFSNPHYYEGVEPGDQPDVHADESYGSSSAAPYVAKIRPRDTKGYHGIRNDGDYGSDDPSVLQAPHPHFAEEGKRGRSQTRQEPHSRSSSIAASSAEDDTDDFDWDVSDDDDEEKDTDGRTGHRKKIRAKRGRRVYLFCMRLARPVRIFLIGAFLSILALVPLFVVLFAIDRSNSARPHVQTWSIWLSIVCASSAGTFIILDWLPPLLLRLAVAFYGRCPEVFKTWLEVAMTTLVYFKLILCVAWAWISIGSILSAIWGSTRPHYWVYIIDTLQALFATAIILTTEKVALHVVGVNFHKISIKDRLEENQKALKSLDKLRDSKYLHASLTKAARRSRPPSPGPNALGGGYGSRGIRSAPAGDYLTAGSGGDGGVSPAVAASEKSFAAQQGLGQHHRGQSEDRLRSAGKSDRKANFANQLQEALATAALKDSKLYKQDIYGNQQSARKLARQLFINIGHHRKTLTAEDFIPYFKTEAEAREAFTIFDKDKNGDISKSEMREAVQRLYRERRALATSLKDMSSAIQKLDNVLMFLGLILVVFIWLLIFSPGTTVSNLVPVSTIVVAFSFVFGNSAKNVFESLIFVFATHPIDTGDLVCISDQWMFVKEFGLLSTTFVDTTNQYIVAPNALLSTLYIHNARRSPRQWETTNIQMSFDTALQTIDEFRRRLRAWVQENDREWGGGLEVNYNTITNQNAVEMVIAMEHKTNFQNWGERWTRRTKLMRRVKEIAEELSIGYTLPPQPVSYHPRSNAGLRANDHAGGSRGPSGFPGAQKSSAAGQASGGPVGFNPRAMGVGGVGSGFGLNKPTDTTS
ncbi:hypothetical protein BCV69DRAFT_269107 [Microstroma glucosiphilum]|uniref:EF-hand domain-containing protein n=1 Tax=Pseudomicrostroma glucosiphilum TaxID=1684307 RepID=A0A316U9B3_9BASI|nr:hypothetical protein BCV69DRAFT_269107 [Pseudomicrostroma glucosiphilum]PWN21428.1 hypothetical protein BCV69DRAFT_269107 [Pseudomicrostroma glucosiphilum]